MLLIVDATDAFIFVIIKTPAKLKIALIIIAARAERQRVVMHVAIAFGASVQPLTKITPKVKMTVMKRTGEDSIC